MAAACLLIIASVAVPAPLLYGDNLGWADALRSALTLLAALVFAVVFSQIAVNAQRARADKERLAAELGEANRQLRLYAAQAEELATTRERNRLAREIHDGLGHYLTTIHMQIQAARATLDGDRPRAEATLAKAQGLAQEALADVRRSVAALRDSPVERRPLPEALAALVEESNATGLRTDLMISGAPRPLAPQTEHVLYRAAQEALTNVRKHARAARAALALDYGDRGLVRLTVEDDGRGAANTGGGFGLLGLRERTQLLGGTADIRTAPGRRMTVTVEVPG